MAAEREEAKAMAVDFLRARGVSAPLAARAVKKANGLIAHLLTLLRASYRSRYLAGTLSLHGICTPKHLHIIIAWISRSLHSILLIYSIVM